MQHHLLPLNYCEQGCTLIVSCMSLLDKNLIPYCWRSKGQMGSEWPPNQKSSELGSNKVLLHQA